MKRQIYAKIAENVSFRTEEVERFAKLRYNKNENQWQIYTTKGGKTWKSG